MAKPLLTDSAKGDGIVKFPRDSILKYLLSKLSVVAIEEDLQLTF